MAQSIKNRIFGSDIPKTIKQKIQFRQSLGKSSNWVDAFDSVSEVVSGVDLKNEHNFVDGVNSEAEL